MKIKIKSIKEIEEENILLTKKIEFAKKHNLDILDNYIYLPSKYSKGKLKRFDFYQQNSIHFTNVDLYSLCIALNTFRITLFTIKEDYFILNKIINFPNYNQNDEIFIEKYDYFDENINKKLLNCIENNIKQNSHLPISKYSFNYKYFDSYRKNLIFS